MDIKYFVGASARGHVYDLMNANWNMEDFLVEVTEKEIGKLNPEFAIYYKSVFLRTADTVGVTIPQKVMAILKK